MQPLMHSLFKDDAAWRNNEWINDKIKQVEQVQLMLFSHYLPLLYKSTKFTAQLRQVVMEALNNQDLRNVDLLNIFGFYVFNSEATNVETYTDFDEIFYKAVIRDDISHLDLGVKALSMLDCDDKTAAYLFTDDFLKGNQDQLLKQLNTTQNQLKILNREIGIVELLQINNILRRNNNVMFITNTDYSNQHFHFAPKTEIFNKLKTYLIDTAPKFLAKISTQKDQLSTLLNDLQTLVVSGELDYYADCKLDSYLNKYQDITLNFRYIETAELVEPVIQQALNHQLSSQEAIMKLESYHIEDYWQLELLADPKFDDFIKRQHYLFATTAAILTSLNNSCYKKRILKYDGNENFVVPNVKMLINDIYDDLKKLKHILLDISKQVFNLSRTY